MRPQPDDVSARLRRLTASGDFVLIPLSGGASDRWYFRIRGPLAERFGCESLVLMGIAPELVGVLDSFLDIRRFLARHDIPVPILYAEWRHEGLVLLEDFGDLTMTRVAGEDPQRRGGVYDRALDLLVRLHACGHALNDHCSAFDLFFDVEKYQYEFGFHVRKWVIENWCAAEPTEAENAVLERTFGWISRALAAEPRVFTHRDYQTSNLMVRPDTTLGLVDFQDARQGLRQYDLASLLYDSYAGIGDGERERLADEYCRLARVEPSERFAFLLRVAAIQRKLHDAGAFIYTAAHRGKQEYTEFVPEALRLATNLMATIPECREAGKVLAGLVEKRRSADTD